MSDINRDIGVRIRGIRELSDMTLETLAQKIETTPEQLQAYEKGESDIPLSILHDISSVLNITMTELITGEGAKMSVYSVTRKNKGKNIETKKAYEYKSLAYNFSHRKMDPFIITIEAKPDDAPFSLNTHGGQEFHLCLEGSFVIMIGKHVITINEGDSIYFDPKYPHGMKALNGKDARDLVVLI